MLGGSLNLSGSNTLEHGTNPPDQMTVMLRMLEAMQSTNQQLQHQSKELSNQSKAMDESVQIERVKLQSFMESMESRVGQNESTLHSVQTTVDDLNQRMSQVLGDLSHITPHTPLRNTSNNQAQQQQREVLDERELSQTVTLYFNVYVVRDDEGTKFGPLIIEEIRNSYNEVLDQIQ